MVANKIKIYKFNEITSTNDFLLDKKHNKNIELCIAKKQTKGKGQYGRIWLNQSKNALFSLKVILKKVEGLSLVVAISIAEVLTKDYNISNITIKWPNDIYLNDKKLAGILIENQIIDDDFIVVIGVGINIKGSISFAHINKNIDTTKLIMRITHKLLQHIDDFALNQLNNFYQIWQHYDYLTIHGKKVVHNNIVYQTFDINKIGNLLIINNNKIHKITSSKQITII